MPQVIITLSPRHHQALKRKVAQVGKGTIASEIRKAIRQYLAGPRSIEAAFIALFEQKAPKDLPVLLARFKTNRTHIKRDLREIKQIRERPRPLQNVSKSQLRGLTDMALENFGSAEKANRWFYRPNKLLNDCTPFSLLSSMAGVKRVMKVLNETRQAGQKKQASARKAAQRLLRNTNERKTALRDAEAAPVSGVMGLYAQVAAKWGKVDPTDETAVGDFFENVLPTLKPKTQQAIVDELFYKSLAVPTHAGCEQEEE